MEIEKCIEWICCDDPWKEKPEDNEILKASKVY